MGGLIGAAVLGAVLALAGASLLAANGWLPGFGTGTEETAERYVTAETVDELNGEIATLREQLAALPAASASGDGAAPAVDLSGIEGRLAGLEESAAGIPGVLETADNAARTSQAAQESAESATSAATTASETASAAQQSADAARTASESAQSASEQASTQAADAVERASEAVETARSAQQAATNAQQAAGNAQETANSAQSTAQAATESAANAAEAAAAAQSTADGATEAANAANEAAAAASDKIDSAVSELEQRLAAMEAANQKAEIALAAANLKSAIDSGGPFAQQLETYATVAGAGETTESLRTFAAEGVPSEQQLANEWPSVEDRINAALSPPEPEAPVSDQMLAGLRSLVQVRPAGPAPQSEQGGDAILSRLNAAITSGDLEAFQSEWQTLPEPAKEASQEFADKVDARLTAQDIVSQTLSGALTTESGEAAPASAEPENQG